MAERRPDQIGTGLAVSVVGFLLNVLVGGWLFGTLIMRAEGGACISTLAVAVLAALPAIWIGVVVASAIWSPIDP
jgi:uncharacterized membrane protein